MKTSINRDQRGLSHVLLVMLLVIVIGGVGFAGWRVLHKDKQDKAIDKTATSNADASCLETYHDKILCNFATANANFAKLSFTAVDNSTDNMGQSSQTTVKNDGQGNSSVSSQAGNSATNSVIIGKTTYIKDGNAWIKYDTNAPTLADPAGDLKLQFSNQSTPKDQRVNYKNLGKEACGNATCYKYQVGGPTTDGTTYFWIDAGSYRLQRLTIKTSDGTDDITITYGPVSITAPSPTITPDEASAATYESWMQNARQDAQ